jgi:modulator of FtsH protease HflK
MPWSNQSGGGKDSGKDGGSGGGPWGSGGGSGGDKGGGGKGGGPWGQGPSGGGGGQQPDLEELLKRSQEKLRRVLPGGGGGAGGGTGLPSSVIFLLSTVLAVLAGIWAFTFRVNPDEVGIVMRFGQYVRKAEPGWHVKLPPPIETVYFPAVTRQNTEQMGFRTSESGRGYGGAVRETPEESLMLTGDENIVDVNFVVRWSIKADRVQDFLFNIEKPERTIREVAESVMREVIGQTNIQPILTEARQRTEQSVQKLMQQVLDSYGSGVRIDQVQLQKVDPPEQVIDAFRDVQAARADKEKLQNEAVTYANKIVPEAHGNAESILQAAEGYKAQTVAEANGQAARFLKVYEQYKKAPDVTRQRIYLETMERVMSQSETIVLDQKGGQGAIPFLSLDQLQPKR